MMKKVLYLTNIEVPYRVRFFNEMAKYCDLTVVYERRKSANRDETWATGEQRGYRADFLKGLKLSDENGFSFGIFRYLFKKYDAIIVGCCNSPVQLMAILAMKLFRIPYYLNMDGEPFLEGSGLKAKLKRFVVKGAGKYLVAGEKSAEALRKVVGDSPVLPYYFSSLTEQELHANRSVPPSPRSQTVLVVGQYMDYKGLDVALRAAQLDPEHSYLFVGMGKRTELFQQEQHPERIANVRVIPFLQKKDLEAEYRRCGVMVLPSRQECWGLVINEAASFGAPIVSTWGSGAAVEFLADGYSCYLAAPGDPEDLHRCIRQALKVSDQRAYREYLLKKSSQYSIEKSVQVHLTACGIEM